MLNNCNKVNFGIGVSQFSNFEEMDLRINNIKKIFSENYKSISVKT